MTNYVYWYDTNNGEITDSPDRVYSTFAACVAAMELEISVDLDMASWYTWNVYRTPLDIGGFTRFLYSVKFDDDDDKPVRRPVNMAQILASLED